MQDELTMSSTFSANHTVGGLAASSASAPMPPTVSSSSARNKVVCTACRARKKRCDGERPTCSSCRKRNDACSYYQLPPHARQFAGPDSFTWAAAPSYENDDRSQFFPIPAAQLVQTPAATWPVSTLQTASSGPPYDSTGLQNMMDMSQPQPQHATTANWLGSMVPGNEASFAMPTMLPETPAHAFVPNGSSQDGQQHLVHSSPYQQPAFPLAETSSLPDPDRLIELVEIFFDRFHPYLPFLHRQTFTSEVARMGHAYHCPLLLYSVIALSSGAHPDSRLRASQTQWFNEAKHKFSATSHSPTMPLQTLQSAACLILQALLMGDHSSAWLVLATAWRQSVCLGLNQLDSSTPSSIPGVAAPPAKDWRELEERRRTLWVLFILDRGMCFPIGIAHAFEERTFNVNFPSMTEADFQEGESPPEEINTIHFSRNLLRLLTSVQTRARHGPISLFTYIILSYIFLGRIIENMHAIDPDPEEHKAERDKIESSLVRFRLILPRSATNLANAHHSDFTNLVWLNCILNTATVLLYHRPLQPGQGLDSFNQLASQWPYCVTASKNSINLIRDGSRTSTDLLTNPHIVAPLFTCGRILIIEYLRPSQPGTPPPVIATSSLSPSSSSLSATVAHHHHHHSPPPNSSDSPSSTSSNSGSVWGSGRCMDSSIKRDLEVLLLVFDRASEAYNGIGKKFRNGLLYHLRQDDDAVAVLKSSGSKGLLASCSKWPEVSEEEALEGILPY